MLICPKHWFSALLLTEFRDSLLLSLCFLSVVRLPVVMAAPSRSRTPSPPPPWMCPCGETGDRDIDNEYGLVSAPVSDRDLVGNIILQARISLDVATRFKDDYVSGNFLFVIYCRRGLIWTDRLWTAGCWNLGFINRYRFGRETSRVGYISRNCNYCLYPDWWHLSKLLILSGRTTLRPPQAPLIVRQPDSFLQFHSLIIPCL